MMELMKAFWDEWRDAKEPLLHCHSLQFSITHLIENHHSPSIAGLLGTPIFIIYGYFCYKLKSWFIKLKGFKGYNWEGWRIGIWKLGVKKNNNWERSGGREEGGKEAEYASGELDWGMACIRVSLTNLWPAF